MFCIHIFTIFILYMQFIPLLCITNIAYFVYPFCLIFSLFDNSILELSLISYIFIYYHDSMPLQISPGFFPELIQIIAIQLYFCYDIKCLIFTDSFYYIKKDINIVDFYFQPATSISFLAHY